MAFATRGLPGPHLARYLLLAAFLHGLALFWLRLHSPAGDAAAALPRLEMRLAPPLIASSRPESAEPARKTAGSSGSKVTVDDAAPTSVEAIYRPAAAAPSGADLAIAARSFIQDESRRRRDPMYQPSSLTGSAPSVLERATTRPSAGEKVVQEGIVKITSPDGSSYCLQQPPAAANRDGPVAVLAIPMSCP